MSGALTSDKTLRARATTAIADDRLRVALRGATDRFTLGRAIGLAGLEDAQGLRRAARAVRAEILANLPAVLEQLADNVVANGGTVCWAATAEEATAYVEAVAARHDARTIVKSKSMVTEEIKLNEVLESAGRKVVETDLGEWIIQLAGQTPSHIIAPALHLDRHQVAEILGQVADGEEMQTDPEWLAAFARRKLREEFLRADMGISGANFGVAETGSVALVTNEGNGRMATSLPRVHVAIMGMERVVATTAQLDLMLALLGRSASGQPLTSYTSIITGPRREGEADGPDEFHLVILDNGRSRILGTEFHEILACIRCGACLGACPVYRQIGGHAYGSVYAGPVGAVLTPLLFPDEQTRELPNASSLCGACMDACPVGIPLQDLLLAHRRRNAADADASTRRGWNAWARAWSRPALFRATTALPTFGRRFTKLAARLPGVSRWAAGREIPEPPQRTFHQMWERGDV
ncbi:MAG: LutB/LldF family L-lactate oxidation iron-sulfur protein [Actinomycetota bacterium]